MKTITFVGGSPDARKVSDWLRENLRWRLVICEWSTSSRLPEVEQLRFDCFARPTDRVSTKFVLAKGNTIEIDNGEVKVYED